MFQEEITLAPGDDCEEVVVAALEASRIVVIIWCSHARRSIGLGKERALALALSKRIVPVLLDKTPLPAALSKFQAIDLASGYEHSSTMQKIARFLLISCVIGGLWLMAGLLFVQTIHGKSPNPQLDLVFGTIAFILLLIDLLFILISVARGFRRWRLRASQGKKLAEEIKRRMAVQVRR